MFVFRTSPWFGTIRAHLLANAGVNLEDLKYRVDRATAPSALGGTFEPLIPLGDGDVDVSLSSSSFVIIRKQPRSNCLLSTSMISSGLPSTHPRTTHPHRPLRIACSTHKLLLLHSRLPSPLLLGLSETQDTRRGRSRRRLYHWRRRARREHARQERRSWS
jgi:hypothetical protein